MKNKNNNKIIILDEDILADMEDDLAIFIEKMQERYENEFILPEIYESFKIFTEELKSSLEELNITDQIGLISRPKHEFPLSEEMIAHLKTLN